MSGGWIKRARVAVCGAVGCQEDQAAPPSVSQIEAPHPVVAEAQTLFALPEWTGFQRPDPAGTVSSTPCKMLGALR